MAKYIECESAMWAACKALCHPGVRCPDFGCAEVREVFDAIPAADVAPIKHGRWIEKHGILHPLEEDGVCSICKYVTGFYNFFNYCPNCGAKMGGDNDG